jgi:hypothetical protein
MKIWSKQEKELMIYGKHFNLFNYILKQFKKIILLLYI